MARPYDRCIVTIALESDLDTEYQFFVYGATADELLNTDAGTRFIHALYRSRFPGVEQSAAIGVYDYEPAFPPPANTTPHVYTTGRKVPEFV